MYFILFNFLSYFSPVLAIPELLRILIDEMGFTFEVAWPVVQGYIFIFFFYQ
jgi:glucan phosphorylase